MKVKDLYIKLKSGLREMVQDDHERVHIQFLVISAILALVSLGMTLMNYITGYTHFLMWATLVFGVVNIVNVIFIWRRGVLETIAKVLCGTEFVVLFTSFVIVGEPEGFSAIWAALLPAAGLLLFKGKRGSILVGIQFIILVILFWTPWGRSLLPDVYTDVFMMRFPLLYFAFYLVGLFFEIIRSTTQHELVRARDNFKNLYTNEERMARLDRERNYEIIDVLASEYTSVSYVDLFTEELKPYSLDEKTEDELGDIFNSDMKYSDAYKKYVDATVFEEDKDRMLKLGTIQNIKDKLAHQKSYTVTYKSANNGDPHYCEMKFVKMDDDDAEPTAVVLGFADKDIQIRHEQEHRQELKEARIRAEAASNAKSVFLFNMSHDIRTPMNAIMGFTQMARKYKNDPEKLDECLNKVSMSSEHLLRLVNDVLDMSRIESGKVEIEESEASLSNAMDALVSMVKPSADNKGINFVSDIKDIKDEKVFLDTLRINQLMLNIIGNSIKYTKTGGNINFSVKECSCGGQDNACYEFVVKDTGIGMTEEFLEHIFEPFSREKSSTISGIEGTGLGMTIVKRLVDLMGGTIDIKSELGVGTTVTVKLKLRKVKETVEDAVVVEEKEEMKLEGKKVLLVEDNMLNREIAKDILESEGMIVDEAEDGSISVDVLKEKGPNYYDIVLMDIQMPIMDGYEATRAIRALENDNYSSLPIVAVTANAFEEDRKKAFESGMNGHIGKPINITELLSTLQKLLK